MAGITCALGARSGAVSGVGCRYAQGGQNAAVSHLLDEVVAAAVERSLEPILLDGHILDRLSSAPVTPAWSLT